MSLNSICIAGRLGRDPELRQTPSGVSVCTFAVAVDKDFTDPSGQRGTDWIQCVAWRQRADFIAKYFRKGAGIMLHGRLESRSYADKDGIKRIAVEIIVSDAYFTGKKESGGDVPLSEPPPEKGSIPAHEAPLAGNTGDYQYGDPEGDLPF